MSIISIVEKVIINMQEDFAFIITKNIKWGIIYAYRTLVIISAY